MKDLLKGTGYQQKMSALFVPYSARHFSLVAEKEFAQICPSIKSNAHSRSGLMLSSSFTADTIFTEEKSWSQCDTAKNFLLTRTKIAKESQCLERQLAFQP